MDNYKEKYEQALSWMQSLYNGLHGKTKEEAEHFFPELKEGKSEDERIREELINLVNALQSSKYTELKHYKEYVLWLKKQGKQNPAKWSEHQHKLLNYAISMTDDTEVKRFLESLRNVGSNASVSWSEEDEKMIRAICCYLNEFGNWLSDKNDKKSQSIYKACDWLKSFKNRAESKQGEQKLANPAKMNKNEQKSADNDWVDLGLPSGTLWKSQNQTNPTDDRDFYTYDEAIRVFREQLPTEEQWKELKENCEWTWEGTGYKVTGWNGYSIFLPAAGCRSYIGDVYYIGSKGYYWSSMPDGSNCAWGFYFNSGGFDMYNGYRNYGRSVRLAKVCADCSEMNKV